MRLISALSSDLSVLSSDQTPTEKEIRRARVARARQHQRWTEIPAGRLVPRQRFWLVDADTDECFVPARGDIFQTGTANILADQARLHFVVGDDGELVFYEKQPGTWSEIYARRARREAARR